jgi:DNA-binding IclR family transcriptional regulator
MACIGSDGKPTVSGFKVLHALNSGFKTPEEIAKNTGRALFRVRSGLRQMVQAGLVSQNDDSYGTEHL